VCCDVFRCALVCCSALQCDVIEIPWRESNSVNGNTLV